MNVFSTYLKKRWSIDKKHTLNSVFFEMQKAYDRDKDFAKFLILDDHHILIDQFITDMSIHINMFNDGTYLYELITNKALIHTLNWINKNILLSIHKDHYKTVDVKLRIAIGMINKLVKEKKLKKEHGTLAGNILIDNVKEVQRAIINEELPF